jgi:UDP-N-acetyl-D-mannosaminuronic acid transferase (WecB/TagA/CpsF family)
MFDPRIEKYEFSRLNRPKAVAFADLNFFGQSLLNEEFNSALKVFDVIYCDGYWLYKVLKILGNNVVYKPGPLFFNEFAKNNKKFTILSKYSESQICELLRCNDLNIVELPFVNNVDEFEYLRISKLITCDHIFVSIGCPKQELFIDRIIRHLPEGVTLYAVGAAIDFSLGKEKRAPHFIQRLRLESVWRLIISGRKQWKKWKKVPIVLIWFIKRLLLKIF